MSAEGRHGSSFSTQPTLRWSRQRDLARSSEVHGLPRHPPPWITEGPPALNAGGLVPHSIIEVFGKRQGL